MLLIILPYVFLVLHVLSFVLISSVVNCHRGLLSASFWVIVQVKKDIVFLIKLIKNYVSSHVVFLEHISFFSIHASSYNATKSALIHIDHFTLDTNTVSPSISQAPAPVSNNVFCRVPTDSSADFGTLVPNATIAPSPPMAVQSPSETTAPSPLPLHHSTCSLSLLNYQILLTLVILALSLPF